MQISVRQIGNGYIITYPVASASSPDVPRYPSDPFDEMFGPPRGYQMKNAEWYCATKEQVKDNVRRIVSEIFAAQELAKKDEKGMA